MNKLDGKVALISGSGRGIGRCIALKLASEGARVVVNDLDEEPAEETLELLRSTGAEAVSCTGSVVEPGFAERFIAMAWIPGAYRISSSTTRGTRGTMLFRR